MSETNNQYWNGATHAVLVRERVSAKWANGNHSATRIDAANRAFCIWHYARRTLRDSPTQPHRDKMYRTLTECAKEGWGKGVSDLQETLDHMDRNNGHWSDANTKQYFGGNGRSYQRALIELPEGCANFLAAVDKKLPEMRKVMEEYQSCCQALQALKPSPAQSTSDWERIKSNIDAIKTAAERAQSLLWLGPAVVNATVPRTPSGLRAAQRIEAFADTASPHVEKAVGYVEVVGSIHDAMTVYADATQALNGDRRAGLAFAALSFAMTYVPVLGGFYGTIVQKIPGLINNWREFIGDYTQRFDDPQGWLRERAGAGPAWRCAICTSSGGYA